VQNPYIYLHHEGSTSAAKVIDRMLILELFGFRAYWVVHTDGSSSKKGW